MHTQSGSGTTSVLFCSEDSSAAAHLQEQSWDCACRRPVSSQLFQQLQLLRAHPAAQNRKSLPCHPLIAQGRARAVFVQPPEISLFCFTLHLKHLLWLCSSAEQVGCEQLWGAGPGTRSLQRIPRQSGTRRSPISSAPEHPATKHRPIINPDLHRIAFAV